MADEERDAKLTQRYRDLGSEEPSRDLDASILAASRRAAETRPAPLVVPTGRRRWYFPLAAAAIITLAVAVTVHVDRQQPDAEAVSSQVVVQERVESPKAEEGKPADKMERRAAPARQAPKAAGQRDDSRFAPEPGPRPEAPPPVAQAAPAPQAAPPPPPPATPLEQKAREEVARADAQRGQAADLASTEKRSANAQGALASAAVPSARPRSNVAPVLMGQVASPEQALLGIADLRRQGRHDEADKALAEFRKRFPDYRIPPEMLEKVERR